jgi:hypothetical protein
MEVEAGGMAFGSLLIGLVTGVQPVQVHVAPTIPVAGITFLLDGRAVAEDRTPDPWAVDVDFGSALLPHELTAVARDARKREVARASRWVNLPQPPARLDLVIGRNGNGVPVTARILATSVVGDRPERWALTADGEALTIRPDGTASLPALDLDVPHLLTATAEFSAGAVARSDVVLGGGVTEEAETRLSAFPIRVIDGQQPTVGSLREGLTSPVGSVEPVLVEFGGATIVFVRQPGAFEAARRLGRAKLDYLLKFDYSDRVSFVWPVISRATESVRAELFETMPPVQGHDGGFYWLLTRVSMPGKPVPPPYRFADAVAVAGMEAFASRSRRAVVLVEGADDRDASRFTASQVEGYLQCLGVPLHVWSLRGPVSSNWKAGRAESISSFVGLQLAVDRLKRDLGSQRVAWLKGDLQPGQVNVAPGRGFESLR